MKSFYALYALSFLSGVVHCAELNQILQSLRPGEDFGWLSSSDSEPDADQRNGDKQRKLEAGAYLKAHSKRVKNTHRCQADKRCRFTSSNLKRLADHHDQDHGRGNTFQCKCKNWLSYSRYMVHKHGGCVRTQPLTKGRRNIFKLETCSHCQMKFQLFRHSKTHNGDVISCNWDKCGFTSDSYQTMHRHRKSHGTNLIYYCKCINCDGKFITQGSYTRHKKLDKNED